jgi:DNA-binding PadR family transcriptional regulator
MTRSQIRQYHIVLHALNRHPESYLDLLKTIGDEGNNRYADFSWGFSPGSVSELLEEFIAKSIVENDPKHFKLTKTGKEKLSAIEVEAASLFPVPA